MASLTQVKSGKNFIIFTDGNQKFIKIMGRASYPAFGAKKRNEDAQTGKVRENWGGVLMLPKATHQAAYDAFMELVNEIKAKTPNQKTGKPGVVVPSEYMCIKDGNEKEDETMHGHWLITFSDSNKQPAIRTARGELMMDIQAIDNLFYGGCWINVLLRPWYFNGKAKNDPNNYPKRISCGFIGAQFVKDDTPFGNGRVDDESAWGAVEGADDDGDDGL